MMLFRPAAILAILAAATAGPAHATTLSVVDPTTFGGFEATGEAPGDWTASAGLAPPADFSISTDGNFFNGNTEGVVTAADATTWQYIGLQHLNVADGAMVTVSAELWANTNLDQLRIGYGLSGGVITTPVTLIHAFTTAETASYAPVTFTFTAPGSSIDIDFGFLNAEGAGSPFQIDAVSVSYDIVDAPEPASMALLGTALLGLGLVRRHRRA